MKKKEEKLRTIHIIRNSESLNGYDFKYFFPIISVSSKKNLEEIAIKEFKKRKLPLPVSIYISKKVNYTNFNGRRIYCCLVAGVYKKLI